ncbi:MAG: hypothetical protein WC968_00145 [Bacilli bacterium]
MTTITAYIFGIYQLSMMVRDVLGYVAPQGEKKFSKDAYERRSKTFELLSGEGSPFAHFVSINKDKSEKLVGNLSEFQKDIYSSESLIFRVVGDFVEVDASQHLRVYDMTIGIYQTFSDILKGYLQFGEQNPEFDKRVATLIREDEYYFRSLAHFALVNDLFKLFKEYSDARNRDKSDDNPVAKFINEDIKKVVGFINFLDKHNTIKNVTYKLMTDNVKAFIENMSGQRELPAGKNFPEVFNELNAMCLKTLQDAEAKWRDLFLPLAREHADMLNNNERKNPEDLS